MSNKVLKGLWFGVLGGVIILIALYIRQAVISLPLPYSFEWGEGWHLWTAKWVSEGFPIYRNVSLEPHYGSNYGPGMFLLVGSLYKIFEPSLFIGRLVSFLACLGSSILAFLIIRRVTKSKWLGIVGGILFFLPPIIRSWTLWFRVDTLALFFSLLGIYLAIKYIGSGKVLWAVIPFLLAVFTKQAFIAAPIAVGLYLLITNRKLLLWYGGTLVLGGLVLLGLGQLYFGSYFAQNILSLATVFPKDWSIAEFLMSATIGWHWIVLTLALCSVALLAVRREINEAVILKFYFLVASIECVVIISRTGSWFNYTMEMLTATMLLIPILVWELSRLKPVMVRFRKVFAFSSVGAFQLAIPALLVVQLLILPSFSSITKVPEGMEESYQVVLNDLKGVTSDVLCEEPYLLHLSGKDLIFEPSSFAQYARQGYWDQTSWVEDIRNKRFALIIQEWDLDTFYDWPVDVGCPGWVPMEIQREYYVPWQRCTTEMADAMLESYQLKHQVGKFWVYEPK